MKLGIEEGRKMHLDHEPITRAGARMLEREVARHEGISLERKFVLDGEPIDSEADVVQAVQRLRVKRDLPHSNKSLGGIVQELSKMRSDLCRTDHRMLELIKEAGGEAASGDLYEAYHERWENPEHRRALQGSIKRLYEGGYIDREIISGGRAGRWAHVSLAGGGD